jgi:uncharacterized protein (TIGR02646 family)
VDEPEYLSTPHQTVSAERTKAKDYYCPPDQPPGTPHVRIRPSYKPYEAYKGHDVAVALNKLFIGKCAYCESEVAAGNGEEIEHYRPKGGVTDDDDHNGYWWLASEWTNLLISCTGCNQGRRQHVATPGMTEEQLVARQAKRAGKTVGKLNQFPVAGVRAMRPDDDIDQEDPLLIDPTIRDPKGAFRWLTASELSVVVPSTGPSGADPRGEATIEICVLNRFKLVQARTRLLLQLRYFRARIFQQLEEDDGPAGIAAAEVIVAVLRTFTNEDRTYSALAEAFLEDVRNELAEVMAARAAAASGGPE